MMADAILGRRLLQGRWVTKRDILDSFGLGGSYLGWLRSGR